MARPMAPGNSLYAARRASIMPRTDSSGNISGQGEGSRKNRRYATSDVFESNIDDHDWDFGGKSYGEQGKQAMAGERLILQAWSKDVRSLIASKVKASRMRDKAELKDLEDLCKNMERERENLQLEIESIASVINRDARGTLKKELNADLTAKELSIFSSGEIDRNVELCDRLYFFQNTREGADEPLSGRKHACLSDGGSDC
eukprot:Opistho-2@5269